MLKHSIFRDVALLLAVKVAALCLIWWLCFSPSHRAPIDPASHIAGPFAGASTGR